MAEQHNRTLDWAPSSDTQTTTRGTKMKRNMMICSYLVLVLSATVGLVGCEGYSSSGIPGTWNFTHHNSPCFVEPEAVVPWLLSGSNTGGDVYSVYTDKQVGTYSVAGDQIIITLDYWSGGSVNCHHHDVYRGSLIDDRHMSGTLSDGGSCCWSSGVPWDAVKR